jgi:hypothetical protein
MKLFTDPDWTDDQRKRLYERQIDDFRDLGRHIWPITGATTRAQKAADLLENRTQEEGFDKLILANVLDGEETDEKYPVPILEPKDTKAYKLRENRLEAASTIARSIRRDKTLPWVAPIAVRSKIKDNDDQRMAYVDAKAKTNIQIAIRSRWIQKMEKNSATMAETADIIEKRSKLTDLERKRLKNK